MIERISKIGMIVSLFLVAHALVYPNRFSLIIAILGYIIALMSAVIYGLYKSSDIRQTHLEELSESSPRFSPINVTGATHRLFLPGLPSFGRSAQVVQGAVLSTTSRPLLDDKIDIESDINKIVYKVPSARLNDLEMFRRFNRATEIEEDKYKENIPGYQ